MHLAEIVAMAMLVRVEHAEEQEGGPGNHQTAKYPISQIRSRIRTPLADARGSYRSRGREGAVLTEYEAELMKRCTKDEGGDVRHFRTSPSEPVERPAGLPIRTPDWLGWSAVQTPRSPSRRYSPRGWRHYRG